MPTACRTAASTGPRCPSTTRAACSGAAPSPPWRYGRRPTTTRAARSRPPIRTSRAARSPIPAAMTGALGGLPSRRHAARLLDRPLRDGPARGADGGAVYVIERNAGLRRGARAAGQRARAQLEPRSRRVDQLNRRPKASARARLHADRADDHAHGAGHRAARHARAADAGAGRRRARQAHQRRGHGGAGPARADPAHALQRRRSPAGRLDDAALDRQHRRSGSGRGRRRACA